MKVVFLSTTPLAGMPWRTAQVMNKELQKTGGWARSITSRDDYGEARTYPGDLRRGTPEADAAIHEADIAIVSAYMDDSVPERRDLPAVRHYSTEQFRWRNKSPEGGSATVVAQYQARFAPQLAVLPNCMPIDDPMFKPAEKPTDRVVIVYTPTSMASSGWANKGYGPTTAVLKQLAVKHKERVEVFVMQNRPYIEVMEVRRHAHIVIDECATGSYHSTALEGLSCGAVTVCWLDVETESALERVLPKRALSNGIPFSLCTLNHILEHLETLILNPDLLLFRGQQSRDWMERWYSEQWQASTWINWHKAYLSRLGRPVRSS